MTARELLPARAPSLTARVLRNVLVPLAFTWLLGGVIALGVAKFFADQAFDRGMLDDATSLAANVQAGERDVEFMLTPREVATVLFDQVDDIFFAARRADGSLLSGEKALRAPMPLAGESYRFSDIVYQGKPLRAIVLTHSAPTYSIVIAQTTRGRSVLVQRLLIYALGPQLLLLILLAAWLWRSIRKDLRPLGVLQEALDRRDANDLRPVALVHNSRELEGLGNAVNSLFVRLGDSVRALREFTGNVAHELRTPLAGIRALADYGLRQTQPAVWREQLGRIAESQARASHLVDQLLALALADESRAVLELAPVRLDELARQAVLRHLARADAQGVDLGAVGLDVAVSVKANAVLIEGILDNLVDNALRYGGRTITIALEGRTLSVIDDGPGIAPQAQRDLMLRWSQGPAGQALGEGAGLGLAIVARYAQLLGAHLRLADAPSGGGLCVSITWA